MRNLLPGIAALRASMLFSAALLMTVGFSACSSKNTGTDSQWATKGSVSQSPAQVKGPKSTQGPTYTYDGTLTGTVKDEEGNQLEKVSVVAKIPGDPHIFATATDAQGKYEIRFSKKLVKEIQFSMLGKESVTVPLGKKKKIDVVLEDAAVELDPGLLDRPVGTFRIVQPEGGEGQ